MKNALRNSKKTSKATEINANIQKIKALGGISWKWKFEALQSRTANGGGKVGGMRKKATGTIKRAIVTVWTVERKVKGAKIQVKLRKMGRVRGEKSADIKNSTSDFRRLAFVRENAEAAFCLT